MSCAQDLIVVGAGQLGCRVAQIWKKTYPDAQVFLKTRSDNEVRSAKWRKAGFCPLSASDTLVTAPYVVFSAPPTG
jgi:prephenate dehydrogenase